MQRNISRLIQVRGWEEWKNSSALILLPIKVCTEKNRRVAPLACAYCNSPMISFKLLAQHSVGPTDWHCTFTSALTTLPLETGELGKHVRMFIPRPVSYVTCHMSHVMCHMCKGVVLIGARSVAIGAYPL